MSTTFDPGSDFENIVDGLETVTLTSNGGATTEVTKALQRAVFTGEARAIGRRVTQAGVTQHDVAWHLPVSQLSARPELGATITDGDGNVWTILLVEKQTLGKRWRCMARNLAVAAGLDTLVDVQIANFRKDQHGDSTITWQTWKPSVRAKIQPHRMQTEMHADALVSVATHIVYLEENLPLGAEHRIVDSEGRAYRILKTEHAGRIGELMQVFVSLSENQA